jgi:hypothetical protein
MNFEFDAVTETGQEVKLVFKPYGDAPGRISRHNVGNMEAQLWAFLEWGLAEPKNWPVDSARPGSSVFDVLAQRAITTCYNAWVDSSDGS